MSKDIDDFTLKELKLIGSNLCIQKKYLRQRKCIVFKLIRKASALKLQNWWRRHPARNIQNDDPFTLEPIKGVPFLLYEHPRVYGFQVDKLIQYFESESNFINPFTRRELLLSEIQQLDRLGSIMFDHPCHLAATYAVDIQRRRERVASMNTFEFLREEYLGIIGNVFINPEDLVNPREIRYTFYEYVPHLVNLNLEEAMTFLGTIISVIDRLDFHNTTTHLLRNLAYSLILQESVREFY